jgi:triosephosphate isomerase (TIM)
MGMLIVANWKMHPRTEREAVALARASDAAGVVICPPFPFIQAVGTSLRKAALGAQDAAPGTIGPRTGEVSIGELKALGVRYVILGHSERRAEGERDAQIAEKVRSACAEGLTPILCVGEPASVRAKGLAAARDYVKRQLSGDLKLVGSPKSKAVRFFIAYEPVWAISTSGGRRDPSTGQRANETPADAARMATLIRSLATSRRLPVRVLYGGSVNAGNIAPFLARPEFSGVLVGGASIRARDFKQVLRSARQ